MFKSIVLFVLVSLTSVSASAATVMTVLVTGANRGIGLEMVKQMRAQGLDVIGTARKPAEAEELRATGARVEQLDVTDAESLAALAETLKGVKIDMLVNNAGVGGQAPVSFRETDFAATDWTFAVNTLGPMRVTQALIDNLDAGKHKTVIHISSVMGSIERNRGGYYGYRASKAALNMMNKSLAQELGEEGYTCVVMHPGWVQTRMGGPGAAITSEESVKGMLQVFAGLGTKDNGRFYDYQGESIPW
ncbi:SDR family oxidoreductase [Halioglobus sp. HI00S01]|uniref:SDR family oxidoreductase n=1 Tax=Halioglobus sp. HI00S01 TaxID=1822214 RepID=UPI000A97F10D|nr:SDR family oxidoreductase [Halioglobus sp. HI00S01]